MNADYLYIKYRDAAVVHGKRSAAVATNVVVKEEEDSWNYILAKNIQKKTKSAIVNVSVSNLEAVAYAYCNFGLCTHVPIQPEDHEFCTPDYGCELHQKHIITKKNADTSYTSAPCVARKTVR